MCHEVSSRCSLTNKLTTAEVAGYTYVQNSIVYIGIVCMSVPV
jgi:hypothetical protein